MKTINTSYNNDAPLHACTTNFVRSSHTVPNPNPATNPVVYIENDTLAREVRFRKNSFGHVPNYCHSDLHFDPERIPRRNPKSLLDRELTCRLK